MAEYPANDLSFDSAGGTIGKKIPLEEVVTANLTYGGTTVYVPDLAAALEGGGGNGGSGLPAGGDKGDLLVKGEGERSGVWETPSTVIAPVVGDVVAKSQEVSESITKKVEEVFNDISGNLDLVAEAPKDDKAYGRLNGGWVDADARVQAALKPVTDSILAVGSSVAAVSESVTTVSDDVDALAIRVEELSKGDVALARRVFMDAVSIVKEGSIFKVTLAEPKLPDEPSVPVLYTIRGRMPADYVEGDAMQVHYQGDDANFTASPLLTWQRQALPRDAWKADALVEWTFDRRNGESFFSAGGVTRENLAEIIADQSAVNIIHDQASFAAAGDGVYTVSFPTMKNASITETANGISIRIRPDVDLPAGAKVNLRFAGGDRNGVAILHYDGSPLGAGEIQSGVAFIGGYVPAGNAVYVSAMGGGEDGVTIADVTERITALVPGMVKTSLDPIVAALSGKAESDDPRFTDVRTPTAHATMHASNGSDPVSPASIGAATPTDITTALNAKITYGVDELEPGVSPLANGVLYLQVDMG